MVSINNRYGMIASLPKLQQALGANNGATTKSARDNLATNKTTNLDPRAINEKLADAGIKNAIFKGDPENQVIVIDLDETLLAGDKHPIDAKREAEINAMGDRKVQTIPKDHPKNTQKEEIKYVLRPGVDELLEYLGARGYKFIGMTRNWGARAETICAYDPVLSKYIHSTLGRSDLLSKHNRKFKRDKHHPDNRGWFKNTFWGYPNVLKLRFQQKLWSWGMFRGALKRWSPAIGTLGKFPPNAIELLKAKGDHSLDNYKPARILVDNSVKHEKPDAIKSGAFTWINPNVDHNGDGKSTDFFATDPVPKIMLKDPNTGEEKESYLWVKNVIDGIEKGWKVHYKETFGKEVKV